MSDINIIQAAEDARSLARQFKAVLSLVDALDHLGSIEQATKEAEQRRNRALIAAEEANDATRAAGDKLVAAERALDEATKAAAACKTEAEAEGAVLVAEAQRRANTFVQAAVAKVKAQDGKLADLARAESELNKRLS